MSTEVFAVLAVEPSPEVIQLVADVAGARHRATKAGPGDRADIERFEMLATRLELLADERHVMRVEVAHSPCGENRYLLGGTEEDWGIELAADVLDVARSAKGQGLVPVLRVYGLEPGATAMASEEAGIPGVVERFESGGKKGRAAVEARFRDQIAKALDSSTAGTDIRPISPSGIQNAVVTEILRDSVLGYGGQRVDVPVEYRDGSRSAHPFPLRCLALGTEVRGEFDLKLKFALLSIRHSEMDAAVDGAWLRNAEISRPRPAALTDDLVFATSCAQLDELTDRGQRKVRIEMYQTGLETAVVGFYRAVTYHLLRHPSTVAVEPMYFSSGGEGRLNAAPFKRGTPWTM